MKQTAATMIVKPLLIPPSSAFTQFLLRVLALILSVGLTPMLQAETLEEKLKRFEQTLAEQQQLLKQQSAELERVRNQLKANELDQQRGRGRKPVARDMTGTSSSSDARTSTPRSDNKLAQTTQSGQAEASQPQPTQKPVGKAPEVKQKDERPAIPQLAEIGGVLTPKGTLVLEPGFQYSNAQVNRFTFVGIEILETFLIGLLEAQDTDRDLFSPQISARYGLTDRLELETKVPFLFREDRLSATIPQVVPPATVTRELDGQGIGDIEFAAHYQLNKGGGKWPYFIGNVRYKAPTGRGPFDVARTADGFESELPTGSGFHSVEPSITALMRTDPAVLFANAGYLINFSDDVNKTFGNQTIGNVDPGDAFRLSFGMAFSLNPRTSFSLGYKHDFINGTDTTVNGVSLSSSSLDVGAMLLGFSYRLTDRVSANLNLELGVTADAPDVLMSLKVPMSFGLF